MQKPQVPLDIIHSLELQMILSVDPFNCNKPFNL